MVNIDKQIAYWKQSALEDLDVAAQLVQGGKIRHGLFFAHLAIEKALKAFICKTTQKLAPKLHNLVRLWQITNTDIPDEMLNILAEMNEFNLEGRYPIGFISSVSKVEAENYIKRTEDVLQWLIQQL
ncbi:MAG: HEPN domain-containing protein [Anaerohalosphaeraceae bacterium]|nr:HEPN domain-containing protein [Anaerohalosphaeraceae bacterium]